MSGTLSLAPQESMLSLMQLCDLSPLDTPITRRSFQEKIPNRNQHLYKESNFSENKKNEGLFYRGPVISPAPTSIPLNMINLTPTSGQLAYLTELAVEKSSSPMSIPPKHLLHPTPTKLKFKPTPKRDLLKRTRPISMWHDPVLGRTRVTVTKHLLFCNHCKLEFRSKTTYRPQFDHHLVNHKCKDTKRRQYVVGVRHRKCNYNCLPKPLGCIQFVGKKWKKETLWTCKVFSGGSKTLHMQYIIFTFFWLFGLTPQQWRPLWGVTCPTPARRFLFPFFLVELPFLLSITFPLSLHHAGEPCRCLWETLVSLGGGVTS